jgi:hypothetical protein
MGGLLLMFLWALWTLLAVKVALGHSTADWSALLVGTGCLAFLVIGPLALYQARSQLNGGAYVVAASANPHGSIIPAEASLSDAENLFRQPGPLLPATGSDRRQSN